MTPPKKTEPVRAALDADTFVREQYDFARSHRLKGLLDRAQQGHLELFITDVTEREIHAGITRRVTEAITLLQNKKTIRILQNTSLFSTLPSKADLAKTIAEVKSQFQEFCSDAGIEIISTRHVSLPGIMEAYFNETPPFEGREAKKHEFPDAVTVAALGDWASYRKLRLLVVSNDSGVRKACEGNALLEPVAQTEEVLNRVTERVAAAALVSRARSQFRLVQAEVRRQIEDAFASLGFYISDDQYEESHVASADVEKVRIRDLALTDVDEETAVFDMTAIVDYTANVSFDDPEFIIYAEGDRYAFYTLSGDVTAREEISVTATITLDSRETPEPVLVRVELHVTDIDVPMDDFVQDGPDSPSGTDD